MQVEPNAFVAAMRRHWQGTLRNTTSPRLEAVWHLMAETLNAQIEHHREPSETLFKVLTPETGAGKSQGVAVYCSMLPSVDHPGVLIVTRMKVQADELAATVNRLAGADVALAYHSDNRVPAETLADYPVLVITHKAYEIGLDAVNRGQPQASSWSAYHRWALTGRRLIVIDEALEIVEEAQVDAEALELLLGSLPLSLKDAHPEQVKALARVRDVLLAMHQKSADSVQGERVLWRGTVAMPATLDMTPLRQALRGYRFDHRLLHKDDQQENARLIARMDRVLKNTQAVMERWNYYAMKLGSHTMNSARLIVPDEITGAVILDATASSNVVYEVFERAEIISTPRCRDYGNVTLHVSRGHAVGKSKMVKHAKQEAAKLFQNLQDSLPAERRVLVVCHKWVEPYVVQYKGSHFAAFDAVHWGALDGRNDWSDHDTAVIFGLPYRDTTWSVNTFMALQGLQSTEWLRADGDRPFKRYRDIRAALNTGQLVVSVVQAINRIRCRRVVDADGNCRAADVFLLLPAGKVGDDVLAGIKQEMPGINVADWSYHDLKRKPRRSGYEESLVSFAANMRRGYQSATTIQQQLGISGTQWKHIARKLKDQSSDLARKLADVGVVFRVERQGKTTRAALIREAV